MRRGLMEFLHALTGSLFPPTCFLAIGLLTRKSELLKPVGAGLNLIALFLVLQVFLRMGVAFQHQGFFRPCALSGCSSRTGENLQGFD